MLCVVSYLKSVLRYKYLILDTYHLATLCLHEEGYEDAWLFFEAKRGPQAKKFGEYCCIEWWHDATRAFDVIVWQFACTQDCPRRAFYKIFEEMRPIINETNEVYGDGQKEESNK